MNLLSIICLQHSIRSMARRRFDLYVRNKRDEYITTIELHRSEEDKNIIDTLPSKFVVADYTRDGDVMEATASSVGALTMVAVRDQHRLKSFRSYLANRKKAGVVKHPGGGRLCMLPVSGSGVAHCESIVVLIDGNCGGGAARSVASAEETSYSRNEDNSPRRAPPPPTPPSGDSEGGMPGDTGGIGGLLGSIMSTISQTHKGVAHAAPVDRVAQAQERHIKRRVERFKAQVREQLEAFSTDPVATSHVFPHVEKSLRAIQHGLVDYFDGITARTEGDADDRHVVVYKLGYEPPDDEVQLDPQVLVGSARKVSSSPASAASMPAFVPVGGGEKGSDAGDLVRIGTIVKDRRTVQEIEEATRKRRRHGYDQ